MRHRLVSAPSVDLAVPGPRPPQRAPLVALSVGLTAATAWALLIVGEATGVARHLDHDAVLESGSVAPIGIAAFLLGWLVAVLAMTAPTVAPALGPLRAGADPGRTGVLGPFLGGFALVWAVAGLAVLGVDMVVHLAVHRVPALEARPWLVAAGVLAAAGAIQLLPSTRRALAAARRPVWSGPSAAGVAFRAGQRHGRRCLRSDGPLMLVMFAVGASLAWMAVLTVVMVGERSGRAGQPLALATGVALVAAGAVAALEPSLLPFPSGETR
jgi:predicted metal-binding membrane protein